MLTLNDLNDFSISAIKLLQTCPFKYYILWFHINFCKRVDPKSMVYLHNRILRSREEEGAYTLCNSMDGTGEHYAKLNKPDGEGQIPYDLTFNI